MEDQNTKKTGNSRISRRAMLKAAGVGAAGASVAYGLGRYGLFSSENTRSGSEPSGEMTYRVNPKNGDRLSLLGFGCMRFPVLPEASRPGGPEIDEPAAFRLIDYALAHGVNYFDTAWPYHAGMSEVVMGKALSRHPRDKYFVSDKMPGHMNPSLDEAKKIFEAQLERCHTEYFDYYFLHSLQRLEQYKECYEDKGVLEYLIAEKRAGRIRNLGWSFHGNQEMLEYLLASGVDWDMALVQLNYHDLMHEYKPQSWLSNSTPAEPRWILETMRQTDIPLFVMEPLLGGRLARLNRKSLTVLQEERPNDTAASWAFRYVASLPNVVSVLSGMTYMEHLQDNLKTYSPWAPLSDRETSVLQKALNIFVTGDIIRCTACSYCMPCPYGVDIPAVFIHYNNCVDDEQVPKGERSADYIKARRAFLVGYDRSVPELRQAMRCTACNECLRRCPQEINIPAELSRLGAFAEKLRNEV